MTKRLDRALKNAGEITKRVDQFGDLLDSISALEDKRKHLWKEIYENAFIDRMNAYMLFTDAYTNMQSGTASHVQLGSQLTKYIERMNKSNDQLLKLAELIAKEEEKSNKINPDDLFKEIQG